MPCHARRRPGGQTLRTVVRPICPGVALVRLKSPHRRGFGPLVTGHPASHWGGAALPRLRRPSEPERSYSSNIPTSIILTPSSRYLEHFARGYFCI